MLWLVYFEPVSFDTKICLFTDIVLVLLSMLIASQGPNLAQGPLSSDKVERHGNYV